MNRCLLIVFVSVVACSSVDDDIEKEIGTIKFGDTDVIIEDREPIQEDKCPELCLKVWNECIDRAEEACGGFPYPPEIWTVCESKSYYKTCNYLEKGCLIDCRE